MTGQSRHHVVESREHDALEARVVRRVAMRYAAGADPAHDRPAYVRAASGLVWVRDRLAVIQDDASFIALVDPATGSAEAFALPAAAEGTRQFDDSRGNKAHKLDLEAITTVPSRDGLMLAAFGSGSLAPREVVVLVSFADGPPVDVAVHRASTFYSLLRRAAEFAGSDMNIEGALLARGTLTLFGRGNGTSAGEVEPVNASCQVGWAELVAHLEHPETAAPPPPAAIVQYDLGTLEGIPLGFTDVTSGRGDWVLYSAAAEASPDATRDGQVHGSVLGMLGSGDEEGRWGRLSDENGAPLVAKVEGVTLDRERADRAYAVVDTDDHTQPSELLELRLSGPWW